MAEPTKKGNGLEDLLEDLSRSAFGRGRKESIQTNVCVACGKPATEFADELSAREFTISGLCQACQDEVFGGEEEG